MNRILTIIVVAILALVPQLSATPEFWITQLNYIGLASLVVLGLLLLTGVGGLTSFGQAAFVGIGAYSTTWLTTAMGWSPWAAIGRASCRERVCQYGEISVVAVSLKKKTNN